MRRDDFIGITFDSLSLEQAANRVAQLSESDRFGFVVTPNVDHAIQLSRAGEDAALRISYAKAALILCDSRILAGLARLCGRRLSVAPGSDLTRTIFTGILKPGDCVAIVGGDDRTLDGLRARFPGPEYCQHVPPMGFIRDANARAAAAAFVAASGAKYIFFAVGSPQSEALATQIAEDGKAIGIGLCIGASIEFIIGTKRRAPVWMQQLSLEWLFRLLSEPRRLWRRYLVEGPAIFAIVLRWRLTGRGV